MPKRKIDKLARAKARPDPAQWGEDEVMTLVEAAAVFFPLGPLTISSLRRAAATGTLEIAKVAGKDLTTPRAICKLVKPSCRAAEPSRHDSGLERTMKPGSSSIVAGKSAQAAAATTLTELRRRSRPISASDIPAPSGQLTRTSSR
ncbi:excisionase [Bradyrhizobium elkanii USDA 61]|nr:excisionase [Bradyrhizobium elkanii USDA 61]